MTRFFLFNLIAYCTFFSPFVHTASSSKKKPALLIRKHRSADLLTHIAPKTLTLSAQMLSSDQDFAAAISMNTCIGEALKKHYAPTLQNDNLPICSSGPIIIPSLQLTKKVGSTPKLLEQAYRALALLELVKKKYPDDIDVKTQIALAIEYISKLDPPTQLDGIPESARGSSERKRRWQDLNLYAKTPRPSSPLIPKLMPVQERTFKPSDAKKNKHKKIAKRRTRKKDPNRRLQAHLLKSTFSEGSADLHHFDATSLLQNLNKLNATESEAPIIPHFADEMCKLILSLEKRFASLSAPGEGSPRYLFGFAHTHIKDQHDAYQNIISLLLPLFTPLVEHYYAERTSDEKAMIENGICTAYTLFTNIQKTGVYIITSEQTSKNIDTCAIITQDIKTPRSKRKEEYMLHVLQNNFTETMSLITKKQKLVTQGPASDIHDQNVWESSSEISELTLLETAKKLLKKLTRSGDLLRLNLTISRYPRLNENPEIKSLMDAATKKIADEALKEREQISPRKHH